MEQAMGDMELELPRVNSFARVVSSDQSQTIYSDPNEPGYIQRRSMVELAKRLALGSPSHVEWKVTVQFDDESEDYWSSETGDGDDFPF